MHSGHSIWSCLIQILRVEVTLECTEHNALTGVSIPVDPDLNWEFENVWFYGQNYSALSDHCRVGNKCFPVPVLILYFVVSFWPKTLLYISFQKMLAFSPQKRISAIEALQDEYFEEFHDTDKENTRGSCPNIANQRESAHVVWEKSVHELL